MLATQLYPAATFPEGRDRDSAQYLPAKDVESFKKLLPPPIEFVEGSSSGILANGEGKYQPINGTPSTLPKSETFEARPPQSSVPPSPAAAPQTPSAPVKSLWTRPIDTTWLPSVNMGCGLNNTGNTCFLNSALQCLIHTTPLVRVLATHSSQSDPCRVKKGFCMACSLRSLMRECFEKKTSTTPYQISNKLGEIAKHMRKGRQEDSHEFLRYAIDALQKSCLAGYPPKIDHKLAVTTWVHKIFGGRLRSRVTCLSCGYNSDTFDDMLDLSVDIYGVDSLQKALRKFVAVDHLKGVDKYKCDKCKKHVAADKSFTVHEAPVVLSIHLKRFSPMGRKMGQPIRYDEQLSLQPVMSEGQYGPTYSLYGVISHAGGGPNSGHYYSHVKNASGQWYEMNDESVTRAFSPPTSMKNAYILFYIRNKGQALEAVVAAPAAAPTSTTSKYLSTPAAPTRTGLVAGMKKRKIADEEEAGKGAAASIPKPFIGPRLPSPPPERESSPPEAKKQKPNPLDPQAQLLKQKIAAASQPRSPVKVSLGSALLSLSQYKDDDEEDDDDDIGEKIEEKKPEDEQAVPPPPPQAAPRSPTPPSPALTEPSLPPSSTSAATSSTSVGAVPVSSFYASSTSSSKSKGKDRDTGSDDESHSKWARTPITPIKGQSRKHTHAFGRNFTGNPYSRMTGGNNLRQQRDGDKGGLGKRFGRKRSMAV